MYGVVNLDFLFYCLTFAILQIILVIHEKDHEEDLPELV